MNSASDRSPKGGDSADWLRSRERGSEGMRPKEVGMTNIPELIAWSERRGGNPNTDAVKHRLIAQALQSLQAEVERKDEALKAAEPLVETLHSIVTGKDTRAIVFRVLKQVRAVLTPQDSKEGR